MRHWPTLVSAAALLAAGAARAISAGAEFLSVALIVLGSVTLGVWLEREREE